MRKIISEHRNKEGDLCTLSSDDVMVHALEVYLGQIVEAGNPGEWDRDELWMIPQMIKEIQDQA